MILKEQGRLNPESIFLYNKIIERYLRLISNGILKNSIGKFIDLEYYNLNF